MSLDPSSSSAAAASILAICGQKSDRGRFPQEMEAVRSGSSNWRGGRREAAERARKRAPYPPRPPRGVEPAYQRIRISMTSLSIGNKNVDFSSQHEVLGGVDSSIFPIFGGGGPTLSRKLFLLRSRLLRSRLPANKSVKKRKGEKKKGRERRRERAGGGRAAN